MTSPPSRPVAVAAALALVTAGCLGPGADEPAPGGDGEPAPRPIRLETAAAGTGLEGCAGTGNGTGAGPATRGAGWADYDRDGDQDLYLACDGPNRLLRNDNGAFTGVAEAAGVAGNASSWGVAWGDVDDDGCVDLYVANGRPSAPRNATPPANALYRNTCQGSFQEVPGAGGAAGRNHSSSAVWADPDLDGDLDLFVANRGIRLPDGRIRTEHDALYRNDGNGSFRNVAPRAGVAGAAVGPEEPRATPTRRGMSLAAAWLDYNKDGLPDLYVADGAGVSALYRNLGNGTFEDVTQEAGLAFFARDRGLATGDVDGDKDVDVVVGRRGPDTLLENRHESVEERGTFDSHPGRVGGGGPTWGASLADLDADGDLDLVTSRGASAGNGAPVPVRVQRNTGDGRFRNVTAQAGIVEGAAGLATAVADATGDGSRDVVVTGDAARLYRNTGPQSTWLGLDLHGNRSTSRGSGALIFAVAGNRSMLREVHPGGSVFSTDAATTYLGLDGARQVATLEILWPSGIRQVIHEIEPVNRTIDVTEEKTVKTSCPLLFGWNGTGYGFRADVLGNAYMGWRTAPGDNFMVPDPTERIRFDGLEPRNGSYRLRLLEALQEINYLDEVELTAVDHPADVEVLPDEAFDVASPHDDLGLVQAGDPEPVEGAWMDGRDVTGLVTAKDGESPDVPRRPAPTFDGYAEEHTLTLDLGEEVADAETVQLLVDGWTYYPMVTPDLAVEGPYVPPQPPSLEAYDPAADAWVPVEKSVGMPAGTPKQMTVNLSGDLPPNATRVRLTTNLQVHWDRIRVDTTADDAPVRVSSVDPSRVSLGWGGYPIYDSQGPQEPASYDYRPRSDHHVWDTPVGNYTRYGNVTPLLQAADDRFAIFRHGDEVRMRFPADALPDVPDGWERTLFVDLDGFFKDMEEHNAYPGTVEPLPYHGMANYPPEEPYAEAVGNRDYRETWNTRFLGPDAPAAPPAGS